MLRYIRFIASVPSTWKRVNSFEGRLETGARAAYVALQEQDKNILVSTFDGAEEDLLMVFAKGKKATQARYALAGLLDDPESILPPL